jgi:hypothetical protein
MAATPASARLSVLRTALLFAPFFCLAAVALGYVISEGARDGFAAGNVVGAVLFGFVTLLLGYQVVQSIRDLFAHPVETVGIVERQWSRNEFMLFRNGYIFVQRDVFRLEPEDFIDINLGDTVRIMHYPHTSTVASIDVVQKVAAT